MSKKAATTEEAPILLGKIGNNLQMGVVGMPNVGKSSLFNILTNMSIPAENFPFCTIDPNVSRCAVPDERYDWLCSVHKPASMKPAYLSITDIAGLVKGASTGAGLGNAFLSHIQAVDGIFHMIRAFENDEITHVEDTVDPVRDLEIIAGELIAKDKEFVAKTLDTLQRQLKNKTVDKAKQVELDTYNKLIALLDAGKQVRFGQYSNAEIEHIRELRLLTAKPALYLVNLSEEDFIRKKNKWLAKIKTWVDANGGGPLIPISVAFEKSLADLATAEEKKNFETTKGAVSALPKIIKTGYHHLQLTHFFTCGSDEVRCWTIQKGTKAPQAAGVIHNDFEKGFIMAEVMGYADFAELKSEAACKAAGKYRMEGKNYTVQDGDICFFKFNKPNAPKK
ncbi:GTP-binding protein [Heterostelium album PN500]|uniref:Obg-like ATPase 1 n=1 Tax=Heterostelium pallidum (strain ATCC 26659 / Pp 5 / PN500) TaxID=670386 RepID=D3AY64_HETP5|nr:GTP-binding protein [Heterostelium album PN500]EFA85891.1 GTP-binding protein [Heterostelium album PN500]|eukprot:XP_020437997.1 GTP-binding protein [Heterostelium album PN500]